MYLIRATMVRNNRRAGNQYERDTMNEYKELGFDNAVTSRNESRTRDAGKIDICGVYPFAPQCKYTKRQPQMWELLDSMAIEPGEIPVVHFKKNVGRGKIKEEIVAMKKEDWYEIVRMLKREDII